MIKKICILQKYVIYSLLAINTISCDNSEDEVTQEYRPKEEQTVCCENHIKDIGLSVSDQEKANILWKYWDSISPKDRAIDSYALLKEMADTNCFLTPGNVMCKLVLQRDFSSRI